MSRHENPKIVAGFPSDHSVINYYGTVFHVNDGTSTNYKPPGKICIQCYAKVQLTPLTVPEAEYKTFSGTIK